MQILHWPVEPDLEKETQEHYRTRFAHELKDKNSLEIIRLITFDGVAPNISITDIENLIKYVVGKFLPRLSGQGLEVGAGPGTFSSVLASLESVDKMYALEICAPIVELLGPKVARFVLEEKEDKVVLVVGDFDRIQLPDQSLDFVFDFFSLHHSSNLNKTLKECSRVLKPNGFIFCLDKARPDYYNHEDIDKLLDTEYPSHDKEKLFGVPTSQKFTRRMNGEKEYRLKDWQASFHEAGFSKVDYFYLDKTSSANKLFKVIKNLLAIFPPTIQINLNKFLPKPAQNHKFILSSKNRVYSSFVNPFRKEISLLIAYK